MADPVPDAYLVVEAQSYTLALFMGMSYNF